MGGRKSWCGNAVGTSFQSKRWLSLDPCGLAGVSVSWGVHLFALICSAAKCLSHNWLNQCIYWALYIPAAILAMISLYKAWTTDPGSVPLGARPLVTFRRATSLTLSPPVPAPETTTATTTSNKNSGDGGGTSTNSLSAGVGATAAAGTAAAAEPSSSSGLVSAVAAAAAAGSAGPQQQQTTQQQQQQQQQQRGLRRCHKCNDNYKPPRAHHDSVTGRCIVKMDHFCPWVGNAVGALNHKFFCLFLFYTAITCLLVLLMLLIRIIQCGFVNTGDDSTRTALMGGSNDHNILHASESGGGSNASHDSSNSYSGGSGGVNESSTEVPLETNNTRWLSSSSVGSNGQTVYAYEECNDFYTHATAVLFGASLVFLIFTCTMGCEQWDAIETGQGKIARMKMRVGNTGTEYDRVTEEFNEMFGGNSNRFQWHWLWPVPDVQFPRGMKKVILGFDYDPSFDSTPYQEDGCASRASNNDNTPPPIGVDLELGDMDSSNSSSKAAAAVSNGGGGGGGTALTRVVGGGGGGGLIPRNNSQGSLASSNASASGDNNVHPRGMKNRKPRAAAAGGKHHKGDHPLATDTATRLT